MKRILVVDESKAVRETLALLLGQDYEVVQDSHLSEESLSYTREGVDLLILGIPLGFEPSPSLKVASRVHSLVLFLLDSKSSVGLWGSQGKTDFLVKPFNPYELREKVAHLLAQANEDPGRIGLASAGKDKMTRYLEFPYLPESTAALAKRFALTPLPLLVVGEVGCGQERVARAIYSLNSKAGPWIHVCPPEIAEGSLREKIAQLTVREGGSTQRLTLFLDGLEGLLPSAQASLLLFLEKEEERGRELWILSSSKEDLLERVYRGEFLDPLYYRLATLTLRLQPLRDRRGDLPSLAAQVAQEFGERLDLGNVIFSPDAMDRLCNYLWFGNIKELETVIARTLVIHRKVFIEAQDVVLDTGEGIKAPLPPVINKSVPSDHAEEKEMSGMSCEEGERPLTVPKLGNGDVPDLRVLINELAHELKNPMVTIKTFSQLLAERFDDATFRSRFQEVVSSDIERMDDLLEALLDFSRFSRPSMERITLYDQLQRVLEEVMPECVNREASIRWGRRGEEEEVFVDEAQFRYAFKDVLRTVLTQVKPRGEIQIDVEKEGGVTMSYAREEGGLTSLGRYLSPSSQPIGEEALPLRILLAKNLLARNGGGIEVNHLGGGQVQIRIVLPAP